jgi:hypothetical protein
MRFQDRDYETQLAKVAWWLQLADYWNERDPKFAEMLHTRAREIQRAKDQSCAPQNYSCGDPRTTKIVFCSR